MITSLKFLPIAMWAFISAVTFVGIKAFKHQTTLKGSDKGTLQVSAVKR
jgi:hypothetical protein